MLQEAAATKVKSCPWRTATLSSVFIGTEKVETKKLSFNAVSLTSTKPKTSDNSQTLWDLHSMCIHSIYTYTWHTYTWRAFRSCITFVVGVWAEQKQRHHHKLHCRICCRYCMIWYYSFVSAARTFKDDQHVYFLLEAALGGSLVQARSDTSKAVYFVSTLFRAVFQGMSGIPEPYWTLIWIADDRRSSKIIQRFSSRTLLAVAKLERRLKQMKARDHCPIHLFQLCSSRGSLKADLRMQQMH